ncbi:MAG: DUF4124 domain-containing protein [Usitatibacter sp.]
MQSSFARGIITATVVAACVFAFDAAAQTLYKLIDKNGKVTYSEKPPKDYDGQVIPMNIDPKANTMAAPKAPAPQREQAEGKGATENEKIIRRRIVTDSDRLQEARDRVEAARKAYEDARDNPGEEDLNWIARGASPQGAPKAPALPQPGQKGTGARPVPTDEYVARVAALEKAWHDAEEQLRALEKELR